MSKQGKRAEMRKQRRKRRKRQQKQAEIRRQSRASVERHGDVVLFRNVSEINFAQCSEWLKFRV